MCIAELGLVVAAEGATLHRHWRTGSQWCLHARTNPTSSNTCHARSAAASKLGLESTCTCNVGVRGIIGEQCAHVNTNGGGRWLPTREAAGERESERGREEMGKDPNQSATFIYVNSGSPCKEPLAILKY